METTEIVETMNSSPQSRRRRDHSIALMTQRSGLRSTSPQDLIWRIARLFWRRFQHLKWHKSRTEEIIVGQMPTMKIKW
jgi:hypothetical protein